VLNLAPYLKAVAAAIVAALLTAQVAYLDDVFTTPEGVGVGIAFFGGLAAVWAVPNEKP
jgi:hypothetical protein